MGSNTIVYLNAKTELADLWEALDNYPLAVAFKKTDKDFNGKRRTRMVKHDFGTPTSDMEMFSVYIQLKDKDGTTNCRSIWCAPHSDSPLGPAIYMHLGADDEATALFTYLADIFGGFVCANDCRGGYDDRTPLMGSTSADYYLKRAIISGKVSMSASTKEGTDAILTAKEDSDRKHAERMAARNRRGE